MGPFSVTGVVLTGGRSARLGFNKAFAEVGGVPIVERVLGVLRGLFEEVLIVATDEELYRHLGCPVYTDLLPGNNALGGIHAALALASGQASFVSACDMPFLNPRLIRHLAGLAEEFDVVVPRSPTGLEPLHAVYSAGCLPVVERSIREGRLKLSSFYPEVSVRVVEGRELKRLDAEGLSWFNINTAEDLEAARARASRTTAPPLGPGG